MLVDKHGVKLSLRQYVLWRKYKGLFASTAACVRLGDMMLVLLLRRMH